MKPLIPAGEGTLTSLVTVEISTGFRPKVPMPQRPTHTHVSAALFTIARKLNQPKFPSTNDWIKKLQSI